MSNDFYVEQREQDDTDWALMEQEFYEWSVLQDVASMIKQRGYNYVLSAVMDIVDNTWCYILHSLS